MRDQTKQESVLAQQLQDQEYVLDLSGYIH